MGRPQGRHFRIPHHGNILPPPFRYVRFHKRGKHIKYKINTNNLNLNGMIKRLMSVSMLMMAGGFAAGAWAASAPIDHDVYAVQQTSVCKGVVRDINGEALIGATVTVKGSKTQGTITDDSGTFTLKNVSKGATLHISYIGYESKDVKWQGSNMEVTLKEDDNALSEAVVVGYGTMKRSDISGASASLKEADLKGSVITSLDQALQGRAAGVSAVQTSGAPGSSSSIRVRGTATINSKAEPLYVIDGVIVQTIGGQSGADLGLGDALGNGPVCSVSPLSTIDPADILSMEILKDASATAIYGAQGANGVVLITTKHGKAGDAKFSYNGMFAVNRQTKRLDMLDLRGFAAFYNDLVNQGEAEADATFADPSILGKGTNWQDAVFQTALQHSHQISAQGGTEKVKYYVSGSYMNQEGTIIGSEFNRFSMRANLDAQMKKWLKMGLNVAYSNSSDDLKLADSEEGLIQYSLTTMPSIPIYNIDGSYSSVTMQGYTNPNPIAMALYDDILLNRQKLNGNLFFDVTPLKGLTWHTEVGFDINASKAERYKPIVSLGTWHRDGNSSNMQKNSSLFWQIKNYITYSNTWNAHSLTAMVGQEAWESNWDFLSVGGTSLPSDNVHNPSLGTGTPSVGSAFDSSAMASVFTRWTYSYDNRYNATYTYRYDGSSNFGPENRWAGFHSFAASWRFSQEKWLKESNWLSNGKLRIGWGQTGNANIGGYLWGSALSTMETGLGMSYRPKQLANTSIKWESQEQWNVGLDLGFFHDRLLLTVDWYNKESKDMLMQLQLPSYMGTSGNGSSALSAPWGNYGDIRNRGVEITLTGRPFIGNFSWESSIQFSVNRNKLVNLSDGSTTAVITGIGQWTDVVSKTEVGESLYNFYGFVCDGIYQNLEDLENSPKPASFNGTYNYKNSVYVGDIKYKDLNGNGVIDEGDKTNIGSPLPKFTFGWSNTFTYKNFDLSLFITGSYGNKIGNYTAMKLTHMNSKWTNQLTSVNQRARLEPINPDIDYSAGVQLADGTTVYNWYEDVSNVRVANPGTDIPRATINDPNNNDQWSDRYIEDGSYIRLKNISLGYTFPSALTRKAKIETLRLACNIQNLVTITGYSGYDPEVGASTTSMNVFGLDNGRYPSPTSYTFSLNIGF